MTFWTEDRITQLRDLAPNRSASQIAEMFGCTRNAVIGKTHRLNITLGKAKAHAPEPIKVSPPPPPLPKPLPPPKPAPRPIIVKAPPPPVLVCEPVEPKELWELGDRECCWPLGDPMTEGFRYCAAPKADFRFCAAHKAMARGAGTPSEKQAHKPVKRYYR